MNQSMPNWLIKRALLTPNRPAIVFDGKTISFADLYDISCNTAGKLTSLGVKKGQFIGILLRNQLDSVFILLALQLLGARAVILNNRLTANEIIWQLRDSASDFLIGEDYFQELMSNVKNECSTLPVITKERLHNEPVEKAKTVEEIELADICTIMYTSGTTGYPKGVIQTYGNHWWSAIGSALNLGLHEDDCWLLAVPLFHISGYSILMKSLIYGMKIVLHEKYDANKTITDIEKEHVTIMSVVSTTLIRIVDQLHDRILPNYFRCMLLGGGPAPLSLLQKCVEKQIPVFQTYGMTETSSQIVTLSPEDCFSKLGSAGKPLFPAQIKIDQNDNNSAGEILVKGPNVTMGYLNREKETLEVIKDGWLHTGDIGYLDDEGFLYVLDRRSDLIISGGENIYPAEIEGVLTSHPQIIDAGVIGTYDKTWGEVPVAFIVSKGQISEGEIIEYCRKKLANYKVPNFIYFINEIPRNAAKKIVRRELRNWLL